MLIKAKIVWAYGYTLLFSVALLPILTGYVDIIGMLPLTTAYLLVIDRDFEQVSIVKDICLGTSLLWVVLLRRYYAYAVVGGAVFVLFYWFTYGCTRKEPFHQVKNKMMDMLLSITGPVIVLGAIFPTFLLNSLLNNHSYAYSAYKSTEFAGEWGLFTRYFGVLFITLMIVGVLYSVWRKAGKLIVGMLLGLVVSCTLFFRIQDMGWHHYYIVVFPMCCFIFLGIHAILSMCEKKSFLLWAGRGLMLLVVVGNFLMSIGIGVGYKNIFWEEGTYIPRVRYDFRALNALERCLEKLKDDGFQNVYCIASSTVFNSDILYKLNAPDINTNISYNSATDVDLRDGFNTQFFDADIILACDPPQYHLAHGQEIILKLNEVMLSDNIFSEKYEVRDEYILDEGVHVLVFVKREPLEFFEIEYIRNIFEEIYPDYPELFSERISAYLHEKC